MDLIKVLQFTLCVTPLHGLLSNDLKKTEAVDLNDDSNDNIVDLPLSCDLTKNFCDINCCNDEDCSETERASFDCAQENGSEEISLFDSHYCDTINSQNLEARAILCLQHANSPYLGEFHVEDEPYSQDIIPNILQSRKKHVLSFSKQSDNIMSRPPFENYYYGSEILKYEDELKKSSIYLPFNILKPTGFCTEMPLRFMINTNANCLYTLSEESCLKNAAFNLSHFLPSALQVISAGGNRIIKIRPEIHCLRNGTEYVSFFRNLFHFFGSSDQTITDSKKCTKRDNYTRLNKKTGVCENVVVSITYRFHKNHTSLLSGKIKVLLADIPLSVDSFLHMKNKSHELLEQMTEDVKPFMYLSQSFSVVYKDAINISGQHKGYKLNDLLQASKNYSSLP